MDSKFYTVCNDKDILLEKNDDDNYRISITINPNKNNDFTLIDIITENELWNLLYELNSDNIETYELTNNDNNTQNVFIKVKSSTEKQISDELKEIIIHMESYYVNNIHNNTCTVYCNNIEPSTVKFNNFKIEVALTNKTEINISFILEDINDLISTYIALYIKKIFYRLSKYLT